MAFTDVQINTIKSANFTPIVVKNCVLSNSTMNDTLSINFYIEEEYGEKKKVFKNKNKHKIKIKVFAGDFTPNEMAVEIEELNNQLKTKKIANKDIFASIDYIGGPNASEDFLRSTDNKIKLYYNVKLPIPKKTKNLNIGMLMYYDYQQYMKEHNISSINLPKSILNGDLQTLTLKTDNINVSNGLLQDFVAINKVIEKTVKLNELLNNTNFKKTSVRFAGYTPYIPNTERIFSNIFFSLNENSVLNMLFYMDYKKIISTNSSRSLRALNTKLKQENSSISSLNILRRYGYKENENSNTLYKKSDPEVIISTSDNTKTSIINSVNNPNYAISEVQNLFKDFRTFQVTDRLAYNTKNVFLEYGVEINITDKFYSYVKSLLDTLIKNSSNFRSYLNDFDNPNFYDSTFNSFKQLYINSTYQSKKIDLNTSINFFVETLNILGFIQDSQKKIYLDELKNILISQSTSKQIISTFVTFYDKVIFTIQNDILSNKDKTIKIQHWLKTPDNAPDTSKSPLYGYRYINRENNSDSFMLINDDKIVEKINKDKKYYSGGSSVAIEEWSLSPEYVFINNNKIPIIATYNNNYYSNLETKIKIFNKSPNFAYMDLNIDNLLYGLGLENISILNSEQSPNTQDPESITLKRKVINEEQIEDLFISLSRMNIYSKNTNSSSKVPFQIANYVDQGVRLNADSSKTLFLNNTICKIYYYNYYNTVTWEIVTPTFINSKETGSMLFCKIEIFQNDSSKYFSEISLPLYDKYFILTI